MNRRMVRQQRLKRFVVVCLVIFVAGFLLNLYLDARVGGGHRYRSSSSRGYRSRGSGGSGGSGGQAIGMLISLLIRYPYIGFPVLILIIYILYKVKLENPMPDSDYSSLSSSSGPPPMHAVHMDNQIKLLQQKDPNFSLPLFLDFCQLLYTNIITFAANKELPKLKTYISDEMTASLNKAWAGISQVKDIIIGNLAIVGFDLTNADVTIIKVTFQTNYTVKLANSDKWATLYENSTWSLARQTGVVSKGPGEINRFGCPTCGGALDDNSEGKCPYCGNSLAKGQTTWFLSHLYVSECTNQAPSAYGGYAPEEGTMDPTRFQPGFYDKLAAFQQTYPDFNVDAFKHKVKHIFVKLQEAWTTHKWDKARPFETDQLFQVHLYWIKLYQREQIRNVLTNINIQAVELVKIQKDAFYDAVTVRIHAAMIDYTESFSGRHIGGSKTTPRHFTEYWTFIRRGGVKETDKTMDQCPNCGAELNIGMVGKCGYCGSKITTGEFNWVLSLIEQDESYMG